MVDKYYNGKLFVCRKEKNIVDWKKVEYSRAQINKAGKIFADENAAAEDILQAEKIVDNWRGAHAFPLQVFYMHLKRMTNEDAIVAQRLKRLDSIIKKLKRYKDMSLLRMQDLGGCRVIVPSVEQVYDVVEKYKESRIRHIYKNEHDYIKEPKLDGYRCYHLVYEYHSDKKAEYNKKLLIEIQVRTYLEHLWATAVETMGLFTNVALKAGGGDESTKRFFALVSSLFAIEEGMPLVPETPDNPEAIILELQDIQAKTNIIDKLSGIKVAANYLDGKTDLVDGYYILILNYNTHLLKLKSFHRSNNIEAENVYAKIESTRAETQIDAVMVSVSSFAALKSAYPNYFADIGEFVGKLKAYLE